MELKTEVIEFKNKKELNKFLNNNQNKISDKDYLIGKMPHSHKYRLYIN